MSKGHQSKTEKSSQWPKNKTVATKQKTVLDSNPKYKINFP